MQIVIILPNYRKIASKIKKREVFVEEKEINETLKRLQKSRAKMSQVLRPCKKGDFVEIEYLLLGKSESFQKDAFVLGEGKLIPGFEENLVGMRAGQEKTFTLTFPESHFLEELKGKEVALQVKMISVKEIELPEINDEFAQNLGNFENLEALKKSIQEGILKEKEIEESQRLRGEILAKIVQETKIEIPDILLEKEKERMLQNLKAGIEEDFKIPFEVYLQRIQKTEKDLKDSFEKTAKERIKAFLVLREIAKREGLEAQEEEIKQEINRFLKNYPGDLQKAQKELDLEKLKAYTEEMLTHEKTLAFLENLAQK